MLLVDPSISREPKFDDEREGIAQPLADGDTLPAPPAPMPAPRIFPQTDAGNAEYFAARFGNDLRYDHRRNSWLVWNKHRWVPDQDWEVMRRAKMAMRQRLKQAADLDDETRRAREVTHALASESRGRLQAFLALATSERPIANAGDDWDRDPRRVGAPNGVIDLRSGSIQSGQRHDQMTMSVAVDFDPQARCPRFERFLNEVFNADEQLIGFVHRAIGYSLTGDTTEQCLFLNYGTGANGKTTLLQTLMSVLGDYALNTPFSTIERLRSAIPNDLAALVNRRFVVASETNDGAQLNEARVKALTGGDRISARFLHCEWFEFTPTAKFWLAVNHRPIVRDDSYGFWRRIRLIPWTQTFSLNARLSDELRAEAKGILAWAVRGCLAWQKHGLEPPAAVSNATQTYEHDSNPLAAFLEEDCLVDDTAEIGASEVYAHYQRWAQRNSRETLSLTMFGSKMKQRFERLSTRHGNVYRGVTVRRPA
jgi:putative DNA primase/helicase